MTKRILWDKEEVVILLEYLILVLEKKVPRHDAIETVSHILRMRARKKGYQIDNVFRNINGITLQMAIIEYLLTDGKSGLKKQTFPKSFENVVHLYRNDNNNYRKLLKQVKTNYFDVNNDFDVKKEQAIDNSKVKTHTEAIPINADNIPINSETIMQIKFNELDDLLNTKPVFVSYFEEEIEEVSSWRKLYIGVFKKLYEDYDYFIPVNKPFDSRDVRPDFCTYEYYTLMLRPTKIVRGKFLETKLSSKGIIRKIKCLLDICSVDEENVIIKYKKKSEIQTGQESNKDELKINVISQQQSHSILELIVKVLEKNFSKGYRINSPLELRRFKRFWKMNYGYSINLEDETISKTIIQCGVIHEGKVYIPQKMLDNQMKNKLFYYIYESFQSGKKVIYYETLFQEFYDEFLYQCIYSTDMLYAYLSHMNEGYYYCNKNYLSKDVSIIAAPYDDIKGCLIEEGLPMKYGKIFKMLSHIPESYIRNILAQNSEFISNRKGEYFHISIVLLGNDDLEDISSIIQSSIDDKHFISGTELVESIKKKYPYIIDQNSFLSNKGLRDAIGYKLHDKFSFKGNIISSKNQIFSTKEVFSDFCKNRNSFTLDELKILKEELGTRINFDEVYENSLRISKDNFVAKSQVNFQIKETDDAIERFCPNDYIPIKKIKQFGTFPDSGFYWNSFLLEHYVAMYSSNYKLIHVGFNESSCVGGIVKKISGIETMNDLIVDVLANNKVVLRKDSVVQYLYDEGYLARRSYSGIEKLIIKAKEMRNKKGL